MSEKKVVLFIVEGPSEEAALGTVMKEYFSDRETRFVVVHGDITSGKGVSVNNVLKKINEQIEGVKRKYRYKPSDFVKIFHLTDTDGVYIPDDSIIKAGNAEVRYYEDHISAPDVQLIADRNRQKREILYKLRKTGKINRIPYQIFFNSCNLEHVLYGRLKNYSDEEKQILSDKFADQYEGMVEDFIKFISDPEIAVQGIYQESWDYIEKDKNSLKRHSNMHMIFN